MIFTNFILATLAASASLVHGTTVNRWASGNCTTVHSGYLSANATGTFRSFTVNSHNQLTYTGGNKNPLKVEFQYCPYIANGDRSTGVSNASKEPFICCPDFTISGCLLAVSAGTNKCVAITNQGDAVGPYHTIIKTCNSISHPKYPFAWSYRGNAPLNGAIYWEGESDTEGTSHQGGCGNLGYQSVNKGVPVLTGGQINIVCHGTPFRLSATAD